MKYDGLKISKESVDKLFPKEDINILEYESPIKMFTDQLATEIAKKADENIWEAVVKTEVVVDKDELVKALEYDRDQYSKGYINGYNAGLNADKWIPVEHVLPENLYGKERKKITVLVCTESGKVSTASRQRKFKFNSTKLEWVELDTFEWSKGKRVTHWMPLPELPTESEDEG